MNVRHSSGQRLGIVGGAFSSLFRASPVLLLSQRPLLPVLLPSLPLFSVFPFLILFPPPSFFLHDLFFIMLVACACPIPGSPFFPNDRLPPLPLSLLGSHQMRERPGLTQAAAYGELRAMTLTQRHTAFAQSEARRMVSRVELSSDEDIGEGAQSPTHLVIPPPQFSSAKLPLDPLKFKAFLDGHVATPIANSDFCSSYSGRRASRSGVAGRCSMVRWHERARLLQQDRRCIPEDRESSMLS